MISANVISGKLGSVELRNYGTDQRIITLTKAGSIMDNHHLTISLVRNRAINLLYASRDERWTLRAERWTFDTDEMTDSEALHQVLTIRDPGDSYMVRFVKVVPLNS